jgi:predicted double-glycine peptidase
MKRVTNTRLMAGVLFSGAFLVACATPPQTQGLLTEPASDLPVNTELENTPFYPQERYQCGPAALATVLAAHAIEVTPEELVNVVYVPELEGSLPEEITAAARRYGMLAYRLQPSLQDLLSEVAHGHPVLVFQNLGTGWFPRWHFAVVVGYDLETGEVILRSGTTRRWQTSLATFERTWSRSHHWALVIVPAGTMPVSAITERYLQATHDLETTGQTAAALSAYRAATRRWPDEARTWLALGNGLYAGGHYAQAERAFRQATTVEPDNPQGWNNLAYALLKAACPREARAAASCAVRLAPQEPNYQDTLQDIQSSAHTNDQSHCLPVDCEALNK